MVMVNVESFIKKYNGRHLADDGCRVSKEYHSFQVAFFNAMRKIANGMGAELIDPSYGHYDMSGFFKRGDKYVYFSYDTSLCGGRNIPVLKGNYNGCHAPMLIRTAKDNKDYHGGINNFCVFDRCEILIDRLLN